MKLASDAAWALKALMKIYEFQTAEEQEAERTVDHNNVGFSGVDAEILSSFVRQYKTKGWLSPKQMTIVYKKMPRYWKQVVRVSNADKLVKLVEGRQP